MANSDQLRRFLFENLAIRGELVSLHGVWQTLLVNQDYPDVIRQYLGEMLAASVLLSATMKFEGSLSIQATGDGALNLMLVECRHDLGVRGVAKYQKNLPPDADLKTLLGSGTLVITLEQAHNHERYQGIVELTGESISDFLQNYLEQSEQLATRLYLASDEHGVAGLLLQQLPGDSEDKDGWNRISQLAHTIKKDELLGLEAEEIIHRLFHEEEVRLFDPQAVHFQCSCSRDKVVNMLRSISQQEAADIIQEQGNISVDCAFCGKTYQFDEIDIAHIYSPSSPAESSSTRH